MTKKTCPLGEDCDLTVAWMAGRESANDEHKARIAAALREAAEAAYQWWDDDDAQELRDVIRALIPDAGGALDRALNEERKAGIAAALEEAAGAVAELVEGLRGLERTMQELLDACGRAGAFDNVVAQFFPDKETRGTRAEDGYKRIDKARNEAKAQADFARALITKHEEPK